MIKKFKLPLKKSATLNRSNEPIELDKDKSNDVEELVNRANYKSAGSVSNKVIKKIRSKSLLSKSITSKKISSMISTPHLSTMEYKPVKIAKIESKEIVPTDKYLDEKYLDEIEMLNEVIRDQRYEIDRLQRILTTNGIEY